MKTLMTCMLISLSVASATVADDVMPPTTHPDSAGWENLFSPDLSNVVGPNDAWSWKDGELSASKDQPLLSARQYEDVVFDFEFKTSPGSNSGAILHCSDTQNWIPNSIEIQLADTFREGSPTNTSHGETGAIYGHVAPKKQLVKRPGEWNRMTITCKGAMIYVVFNRELVAQMDRTKYTSAAKNPDGTDIPSYLGGPAASLPLKGHIGFQGLHGKQPTCFRNVRVKTL